MLRPSAGLLILALLCQCGCAHLRTPSEAAYSALYDHSAGVSEVAIALHCTGLEQMSRCDYASAESTFRKCLAVDSGFGNAHNSLGKLLFGQGKFYAAAWEFDEARNLMPDRPEPSNNLGLVYERVGRLNDAIMNFELAYSMDLANPEYLGNLVRARIKRGDKTDDVKLLLQDLVLIETRPSWRTWAESQLYSGMSPSRHNSETPEPGAQTSDGAGFPELEEIEISNPLFDSFPSPVIKSR